MTSKLNQFSLVLAANENNPTILNPDFLERAEIVNPKWDWKPGGQKITTPGYSTVQYDSGVVVTSQPRALEIVDGVSHKPKDSKIPAVMSAYAQKVQYVTYTGIGINFKSATLTDNPQTVLENKFLKSMVHNDKEQAPQALGLKFVYPLENGRVVYSIDTGAAIDGTEKKDAIILSANYHRDLNVPDDSSQVGILISNNLESDWDSYCEFLSKIVDDPAWTWDK